MSRKKVRKGNRKGQEKRRKPPKKRKRFLFIVDPRADVQEAVKAYFGQVDPHNNSVRSFKKFLEQRCRSVPPFQYKKPNAANNLIWAFPLRGNNIGPRTVVF